MFIPIPIILPIFNRPIEKKESISGYEKYVLIKQCEENLWSNIDYSKTMFTILKDEIKECYTPFYILPKTNICLVDEGEFRYTFKNNLFTSFEEAKQQLEKNKIKPTKEFILVNWRGGYKVIEKELE